jgi:hypothetical protein
MLGVAAEVLFRSCLRRYVENNRRRRSGGENEPSKGVRHTAIVYPEGVVVGDPVLFAIVTEWRDMHDLRTVGAAPLPLEPEANADKTVAMATYIP